jgi:murein DD-endopeptidase MepM/ murein hydrolase activator NlpD
LAAGYFVVILIDGKYFLFYHMKHWTDLQVGDVVAYGDTVGLVGSTGDSTGPHLHLAVSNSPIPGLGTRVDPRPIVESLLADHELAAGDQTPFPSIEEMEDEMLWIFYQPKNNSSPGTGGISRIWAGTREVGGILYADVWGVSPNGEARRLTRKHWVDLYRAAEKAQKPLTVIGCTGNELEQIVYARSL